MNKKMIIKFSLLGLLVLLIYHFFIYPNSYPLEKALAKGDVVLAADGAHNENELVQFIQLVSRKSQAHLRVTAYSKEGYPIIFDLTYDTKHLICNIDNTRNLYGRDWLKRTEIFESIQIDDNNDVFLVNSAGIRRWIFQLNN